MKILKNNTTSIVSIGDVGIDVQASSSFTIQPLEYALFAESSDIVTLVGDSTLTVNDGSYDLSISDGIDLIKGLYPKEIKISGVNSSARFDYPLLNPAKARVDWSGTKVDLPKISQPASTIYTYNGSGELHSFIMDFNNQNVNVELTIDGNVIFSITCSTLHDATSNDDWDWDGVPGIDWLKWSRSRKSLGFTPRFPGAV